MKEITKEKVAILTPTEKIWDEVQSNYTRVYKGWNSYGGNSAISLKDGCYGNAKWYKEHDYRLITLEDYKKYGLGEIPIEAKPINNTYELY